MFLSISDIFGPFHPVLVHLPIGILLLACFFQLLAIKSRYALLLLPAIPVMLFWGMIAAIFSCISGYLLSQSGDYDAITVGRHQWMGIFTAVLSFIFYLLNKLSFSEIIARWMAAALIILITVTGHLGGSLTHGSDYLTAGFSSSAGKKGEGLKPIPNVQEAIVYADIVQPLLQSKCYSCHGPEKQKGKLRLDQPDFIMKGGKQGKVILPGKPGESAMVERLLLPVDDDDHMPPSKKPQLNKTEISLLHWWVSSGADFKKKVNELPQPAEIKPVLGALQTGASATTAVNETIDIPEKEVKPANPEDMKRLQAAGVMIIPVAKNSNYLSANFVTAGVLADSLVNLLEPLKEQLVWLKMDHAVINDATMKTISRFTALTRLQLSNTAITDQGLVHLVKLEQLQSLNLVGVKITAKGILALQRLKKLKHLYLYQTEVNSADWPGLQKAFPQTQLDSGKYTVPILHTDTIKVTKLP